MNVLLNNVRLLESTANSYQMCMLYTEAIGMCLILLTILFILNFKNWKFRPINSLSVLYVFTAFEAISDLTWFWIDGKPEYYSLNTAMQMIYIALFLVIGWLWMNYTMDKSKFKLCHKLWFKLLTMIPIVIVVFLAIISLKTGFIFYIDPTTYRYTRGPGYLVYSITTYTFIGTASLLSIISAVKAKLLSEKKKYIVNAFFILPAVIMSILQILRAPGSAATYFGIIISLLLVYANSLAEQITRDPLTNVNNRYTIDKMLTDAIRRQERGTDSLLWLVICDLNNFKQINDTLGHVVGDEALQVAASSMVSIATSIKGNVGRIGGDEFYILVESKDTSAPRTIVTELPKLLKEESRGMPYKLSVSIGVALYEKGMTRKEFEEHADKRLYSVKRSVAGNTRDIR